MLLKVIEIVVPNLFPNSINVVAMVSG